MKRYSHLLALQLDALPTPTAALKGALAMLTTDNKPYWCDGTVWVDLTAASGGSVLHTILPSSLALTIGAGWSSDSTAPGSTLRMFNIQNNAVVTFSCVDTQELVFTLQRDVGWGQANIVIDGLTVATITSNDAVGGGFLVDVPVLVNIGSTPKVVSVVGLTSASPFVFTKITFVELAVAGAPGGNTKEVQYNDAGSFGGAANVEIDNGDLVLSANAAPVTPLANYVKLFGKSLAGRVLLASVGPSGMDAAVQPSLWRQKVSRWNPPGNATTVPGVDGLNAPTSLGTATARAVATTNLFTRTKRLGYVSAATAAAMAGHYNGQAQWTSGNGAGLGGFFYSYRFGFSDVAAVTGARSFVGMTSSVAAPTNVEPSTLTNCVGLAQLSTSSTQLYLVYGGSVAQAAIALGTNFPPMAAAGVTNGIVYDLTIFAPPSSNGVINVRVERVGTAFVYETTLTPTVLGTQTPANTTLLAPRAWRTNNATLLAVGLDILNGYLETDY